MHQQLKNLPRYTWSHSACNFSSGLGVLNEDQLLKSASFGESDFIERTFVLQVLCEASKIAAFLCQPQNNPSSICLTSQTVPSMQICWWIFPTGRLVVKRDLPQLAQGFRKPQRKPQQPQPKFESKFKGSPSPLNTAGLCSNRLDLRGHLAPRI